jgi:hypothetical protein
MSLVDFLIIQASLEISPIIVAEIRNLQLHPLWIMCENGALLPMPYTEFASIEISLSLSLSLYW